MVLSSAEDQRVAETRQNQVSAGASAAVEASVAVSSQNAAEAKPRIDFNVSEEEVTNHRKKMEEESKSQVEVPVQAEPEAKPVAEAQATAVVAPIVAAVDVAAAVEVAADEAGKQDEDDNPEEMFAIGDDSDDE